VATGLLCPRAVAGVHGTSGPGGAGTKVSAAFDLPDLVDFMLGTGLRIGEVLGLTWAAVDLTAGHVEVRATVVAVKGRGSVLQPRPKMRAGWRRLHLPPWLVQVLAARDRVPNEWDVVFPSQLGRLRDRSNTNKDVREALAPLGAAWVTTHVFRKTAATLLDEGGLTVREIADQLGHRRVSITQDTYFGGTRRARRSRRC
jgi:integrase